MSVTIRPRRGEDIPALATILVRVYERDGYPVEGVAHPEGWLRHDHELQSWTALEGTMPIGQITLTRATACDDAARAWHDHTGGEVAGLAIPSRLFVDSDHRGSGAGRLLMETTIRCAQARQLAVAFDVMLKDRGAIRLYERLGARRISTITHRYGDGQSQIAAVFSI
ncbi:GNAT family N-acetyltransferase [Promicromonospora sukumoe]|uniref:GNAT family N-acetyltransferase n=1 Tax=Promicromonospora sukumoe TaxID=88382 RepID=UPI0015FC09EC